MKLSSFPRPKGDNGRGMHWSPSTVHPEGEHLDPWLDELLRMNVKWVKLLDDGEGSSVELCRRLVLSDMMPIVRLYRSHPNPGRLSRRDEETLRRLVDVGAVYFETNNEPDLPAEWKNERLPRDWAQEVVGQFIYEAERILALGGLPAVPALSVGNQTNLIALIAGQGRADLFARGAWIALHAYTLNHPPDYPRDAVNREGAQLTRADYDRLNAWAWDEQPRQLVNLWRRQGKRPECSIEDCPDGWRAFELADQMAREALGYSVPVLATEGGAVVGWRDDRRYPRVTPELHRDWSVQINQFMQSEAPDYFFTTCHWLLGNFRLGHHVMGWESQAWFTDWWESGFGLRDHLPAVDAVRAMPSIARPLSLTDAEIRGLMSNAAGEGVYGVTVSLLADGTSVAEAVTNARGRFRFAELPAGQYELRAEGWMAGTAPVSVAAGGSENVQITLERGQRSSLRGRALTPAGEPLGGAALELSGPAGEQRASADAAGQYAFTGLSAGTYTLSAGVGRSTGIELDGWEGRELDIVAPPAPALRYAVVTRRLLEREETAGRHLFFGQVTDENGAPLDGIEVEMGWQDAAPGLPLPRTSTGSDPHQAAGYYEFANTPGHFSLRVADGGAASDVADDLDTAGVAGRADEPLSYEVNFQRQWQAAAGSSAVAEVSLPGCAETASVTLTPLPGPASPLSGRRDGERVLFEGLPAGQYAVQVDGVGAVGRIDVDGFNRSYLRVPLCGGIVVGISAAAEAGRLKLSSSQLGIERELAAEPGQTLTFDGLPAGEYQVRYLAWRSEPIILDGEGAVTICDVLSQVPRQGSLAGKVLDVEGEPLAGRRVQLLAGGEVRGEQWSDAAGRYQFSCLSQGSYSLAVEGAGVVAGGIALDGHEARRLDLVVPMGARPKHIEHYLLLGGRYVPGAWVVLLLLQEYVRRLGPTVGFDWREATLARRVTIVGDDELVGSEVEKVLMDAGCLVQRLPGDTYRLAEALAQELQ